MTALFRRDDQGDTGGFEETVRALMTFDDVYVTGGVPLAADQVPFRTGGIRIDSLEVETHPTFAFDYERANERSGNIVIYQSLAGLNEIPNGTDLSAVAVNVTIKGR